MTSSGLMLSEPSLAACLLLVPADTQSHSSSFFLEMGCVHPRPGHSLKIHRPALSSVKEEAMCGGRRCGLIFIAVKGREKLWRGEGASCLFPVTTAAGSGRVDATMFFSACGQNPLLQWADSLETKPLTIKGRVIW